MNCLLFEEMIVYQNPARPEPSKIEKRRTGLPENPWGASGAPLDFWYF
jgi:hypothetical protein